MTLTFKTKDLFTVPKDYILCHCISADFAMGAGVAKQFTNRGVKSYLKKHYKENIWSGEGYALLSFATIWNAEFNLVTKEHYFDKPTLQTMKDALESMKSQMYFSTTNKIAMPEIGCGLDKLNWIDVQNLLYETFKDTDIDFLVCDWG